MDKKKINKLAVVIEKINYLYRSIRKSDEEIQKLETALLKKYITDLYDGILELERDINMPAKADLKKAPLQAAAVIAPPPPPPAAVEEPEPEPEPEPEVETPPAYEPAPEPEPEPVLEEEVAAVEEEYTPEPEPEREASSFDNVANNFVEEEEVHDYMDTQIHPNAQPAQEAFNAVAEVKDVVEEDVILDDSEHSRTQVLDDLVTKEAEHSVEETVAMELNDVLAKQQSNKSIADRLSTGNSAFDISFNQRHAFVNELFTGDEGIYQTTINELAKSKGYIEALTYINLNVRYEYKWKDEDPTVRDFMNVIKRKYLG